MSVYAPPGDPGLPGLLRVFPHPNPGDETTFDAPAPTAFHTFNKAFQLATGWRLTWHDQRPEHKSLWHPAISGEADPESDLAGREWMQIEDLSRLLPPGIPATSRIYCENMVQRLNCLFDEISLPDERAESGSIAPVPRSPQTRIPDRLQPCFLDQFCAVPLALPATDEPVGGNELAGCQWLVHPSGNISAAVFLVTGSTGLLVSGLLAAQSAFLTAARLESKCHEIYRQIEPGIQQMFCGDVGVHSVVWSLDPLMGQASICGDEKIEVRLDRERIRFDSAQPQSFPWYRNQILLATIWNQELDSRTPDCVGWTNEVLSQLSRHEPQQWQSKLGDRLAEMVPSINCRPDLAVGMRRH